ncbi:MAG: aldo/keto reductase [Anaerolineae bacterium]|nr:aldo/keto reductase [Anaerolineae bacterium]
MEYRQLGKSDLYVSTLCVGCWVFAGESWGEQPEADSIATVHAALDSGVNFFDSAEGYGAGKSEEVLGKALIGRRDKAIVATKVSPNNALPATLRDHLETSLRLLQTDYVDLYLVHWPLIGHPIAPTMALLDDLKREGKIRAIGVSNFGPENLAELLQTGVRVDANQCGYNLLTRAVEFEVLPLCRRNGISLTTYMPLMQGILAGKWATVDDIPPFRRRTRHFRRDRPGTRHSGPGVEAELIAALDELRAVAAELGQPMADVALAWIAAQVGVASVIAGARRPDQIERNARGIVLRLDADAIARLNAASEPIKQKLGPNLDMWDEGEDARSR